MKLRWCEAGCCLNECPVYVSPSSLIEAVEFGPRGQTGDSFALVELSREGDEDKP